MTIVKMYLNFKDALQTIYRGVAERTEVPEETQSKIYKTITPRCGNLENSEGSRRENNGLQEEG